MHKLTAVIILVITILSVTGVQAEETARDTTSSYNKLIVNGEIIANEISKATGCAISPILGISVLGAYTYYTTQIEERDKVPWHAAPKFWVPLLVVLLGIILKDSSKITLPKVFVMPLDAIEVLLEKNVSAVLALLVLLSSITGQGFEKLQLSVHELSVSLVPTAFAGETLSNSAAAASSGLLELGILSFIVTLVYGVVWIVSQSLNFLIFLCPFSSVDLMMTTFKNSTVAVLLGAYLFNPYLGLVVALVIIIISFLLFSWSYRFVIFGTLLSSDILFKKHIKFRFVSDDVKAFAGSDIPGVPAMSYGSLKKHGSTLEFTYKPWLLMSKRAKDTSIQCENCDVGVATLSPVIVDKKAIADSESTLFRLRPLYTSHETGVAELLGLNGVLDVTVGKSVRKWISDLFGRTKQTEHKTV